MLASIATDDLQSFAKLVATIMAKRYFTLEMKLYVKIPKPTFVEASAAVIQERAKQGRTTKQSITVHIVDSGKPTAGSARGGAMAAVSKWMFSPFPGPGHPAGWIGGKRWDEDHPGPA